MRKLASLFLFLSLCLAAPAMAQTLEELVPQLPKGNYSDRETVVREIAATGDERAAPVLRALGDRELQVRKSDSAVVIVTGRRGSQTATDPLTGVCSRA